MSSPNFPENNDSQPPVTPGSDLWSKGSTASAAADEAVSSATTASGGKSAGTGWERDVLEKLVFASLKEQKASRRWRLYNRLLWSAGHRPSSISKYATGMAALRPDLPSNKWAPILRHHFLAERAAS